MSTRAPLLLATGLLAALLVSGCGSDDETTTATAESSTSPQTPEPSYVEQIHPDVEAVELSADGDTYSAAVTISSPYDSPERYADGWRVLDEAGEVLGEMELGHDHASEQPFTRTQTGLEIPEGTETVTVEGHDTVNGYGGATVEVEVPTP